MDSAVERAAKFIWEHYSDPLSLADIAGSALLSRFHLCRIFRTTTSVSPCRFLSAVRIYQAKYMLLTTSVSITDIAFAVGYNSVGSFTNYFTSSVGVSPGLFRRTARGGGFEIPRPSREPQPGHGTVRGTVSLPDGYAGARVYLGAFSTAVLQYQPTAAIIVDVPADGRPSPYQLRNVPRDKWFIHAAGVADTADPEPWTRRTALVGGHDPVSVSAGTVTEAAISLRPRRVTDPPVLLALPDLEEGLPRSYPVPAMAPRTRRRLSGAAPTVPGTDARP